MRWLKDVNDDIYDPNYTDVLRVAFIAEFGRGKLADLVALLSGRDFETRQYEAVIAEDSFAKLREGALQGSPETAFDVNIRQIEARGLMAYADSVIENELSHSFWTGMLLQLMDTLSGQSPYLSGADHDCLPR